MGASALMPRVKVSATSLAAEALNLPSKEFTVEASTLREIIPKEPPKYIQIYVNGKSINHLQGLETPLKEGDQITVIQAIGGGNP